MGRQDAAAQVAVVSVQYILSWLSVRSHPPTAVYQSTSSRETNSTFSH